MKKVWSKPKLISLYRGRPEEAVLGGCKTIDTGQSGPHEANSCTGGSECFTASSS